MRNACRSLGLAILVTAASGALAPAIAAADERGAVTLSPSAKSGVPEGLTESQWMNATGTAAVVDRGGGTGTIELEASGLVPNGVYTVWWVNPGTISTDMGPGGGVPGNEFTADPQGNARATITADVGSGYEMMVVAYHADDQTHGETPGDMGTQTFEHLMGPWPGSEGTMSE